jgi:hypothetical protein
MQDHCCPTLNLDRIGTGSHKGFNLEILFQGLEEQFDLPTILIDGSNSGRTQSQVVGKKDQNFVFLRIIDLNPSQRIGGFLDRPQNLELNEFIFEDITVLRNFSLPTDSEYFSSSCLSPVNSLGNNLRHIAQSPPDHLKFSFATNSFRLITGDLRYFQFAFCASHRQDRFPAQIGPKNVLRPICLVFV